MVLQYAEILYNLNFLLFRPCIIVTCVSQVEVSVCVTAVKDVSVCVTVGLPLSLERNTLVLTVAVILTTAIVRTTLGLGEREGFFIHASVWICSV